MYMYKMQLGTLHTQMWKAVDSQQDRPQQRCRRKQASDFSLDKDAEDKKQPVTACKKTVSCCLSWQKQELCTFLVNTQEWVKRSLQFCPLLLLMATTCKSECWQIAQDTGVTNHLATLQPWRDLWNSYSFKYLRHKTKNKQHNRKRDFKMHFCLEQFTQNICHTSSNKKICIQFCSSPWIF